MRGLACAVAAASLLVLLSAGGALAQGPNPPATNPVLGIVKALGKASASSGLGKLSYHGGPTIESDDGLLPLHAEERRQLRGIVVCVQRLLRVPQLVRERLDGDAVREHNEAITDEQGNAWYDLIGYENGDKCAWDFGTALGSTHYGLYNQVINGDDYYLQREYSNAHSGCVLTGT